MEKKKYVEFTVGELVLGIIGVIAFALFLALWVNGGLHMHGIIGN